MFRDLSYALRSLWANRSFSAAAILTLAIGLGANTALFGLLTSVLRPLDLPDASRIVTVAAEAKNDQSGGFQYTFSHEAFKDLREQSKSLSDVVAVMPRFGGLVADDKPAQMFYAAVSENYFGALRVPAQVGQLFTARSGAPVNVVLGYGFWMKHFRGDPGAVGKRVRLNGQPAIIGGVVAPSFRGTFMALEIDAYLAVEDLGLIDPDVNRWLYRNRSAKPLLLYGRLQRGVTAAAAQEEVTGILEALGREHPETDAGLTVRIVPEPLARPLPMRAVSEVIPLVQLFTLVLAGLVLLLSCLNVANLMLVRATAREREIAVRAALGARRSQLVRQMVVEGLLLSALGAAAGLLVGQWVLHAYIGQLDIGGDLPFALDVGFDWRVFLYSLAAAGITGTLIGLWPAWRASRADARAALHDGGRGQSDSVDRQRVRRLLVIGQIAGSLALLVIAGLFIRSLMTAQRIALGFDADRLATVRVDPRHIGYDPARAREFYRELQRRIAAWPEVEAVSVALNVPMTYLIGGGQFFIEGQPVPKAGQPPVTFVNHVGHDYFTAMGIPLLRGRPFQEDDEPEKPEGRRVAIVNETFAQKFWPGQDPIGKRLRVYSPSDPLMEVVGVARDSKYVLVFEAPRPFIYIPIADELTMRTLHVRAKGDPQRLLPRLEREIASLAPDLPLADVRTARQMLSGIFGYLIFRVSAIQAGGMGIIGLTLAIVGVYGVVSFGASLRTREIGIRMALGASPRDVLRLILGQGVWLVVIGIVAGLAAAIAMSRVLARILPLVDTSDWLTFTGVAVGLGAMALSACYLPARRATKVPPMTALRHE